MEEFLKYLALDVTSNCVCELNCLARDGFDLNTVHKLSSKEPGFETGDAGWEEKMLPLCYIAPTV